MNLIVLSLVGWSLVVQSTPEKPHEPAAVVEKAAEPTAKVAPVKAASEKDIPWQEVQDDDGLKIWNRDIPNTNIRELKAEMVVDISADKVWAAVEDIEKYTEFLPYLTEVRVLKKSKNGNSIIAYHRLDPPVVSERDYTLTINSFPKPAKGYYYRHWFATNDKGPKPQEDYVRVEVCKGSWTISKVGENKTKMVYWLHTHPGGSIPDWIANKANSVSLPELFEAIQKRAKDPNWRS